MSEGLEPTEEYDGTITVHVLTDEESSERIECHSYREAIDLVKERQSGATAVKIGDRDDEIVFTSREMEIEDWETQWRHEKRRLSVDVEERECPHENTNCFADDLCVQCKMDEVQDRY